MTNNEMSSNLEAHTDFLKGNLSNPYFTLHSDHLGLVLISKPLNRDNYSIWKRVMTLALNSKNKLSFVNGSIKALSEETDPEGYAAWSRCNDMVHSWIINTLNPEISDSVIYYSIAHEVWEDLHDRFSQSNAPRIFEIQRDITYFRQEQLFVSLYYTKLKGLWDELASYNDSLHRAQQDQQRLMQFLMGLNESYSAVCGQVLLMNPLPSVRQAYSFVSQEEKQRLLSSAHIINDSVNSAATTVQSNNSKFNDKGERSYHSFRSQDGLTDNINGGRRFEQDRDNFSGGCRFEQDRHRFGPRRGRPHCSHCGERGHWVQTCYELHRYPAGHPKAKHNSVRHFNHSNKSIANHVSESFAKENGKSVFGISETQLKQLLSLLNDKGAESSSQAHVVTKPGLPKIASRSWIIDSGATYHISSSSQSFFQRDNNCSLPPVLLPSGETTNIVTKGSLPLNSTYYLHDMLCVPTFKVNLMSVSRLTRGLNCSVTFFPYWCILQDLATRRMISLGKQRDGLYYLVAIATKKSMVQPTPPLHRPACNLTISSTDLWHKRLGHISPHRLSFIAQQFLNFSVQSSHVCPICPLAKQSRLPFNSSVISSIKPFEIIHCDIWGRYRHPSISDAYYFLTIVDDYTRFMWIFFMQHKTEAQSLIKRFFSYVLTQFESPIKIFRSDNGGEFISLRSFFQDNGVIFQHSCVYTPQQNGVVERKHRHILQVARALKFQAQLPTEFWGECALTAVHIINRLLSSVLSFKTPFELLYSKLPSFSHIRVFGCLAYATNVHPSHKFNFRSMPSIFIGYPTSQKAYKLFDLSSKKNFTSRDVRFHENIFPYASVKPGFVQPPSPSEFSPIPLLTHTTTSLYSSPQTSPPVTVPAPSCSQPPASPNSHPSSTQPPPILHTYTRRPKPSDPIPPAAPSPFPSSTAAKNPPPLEPTPLRRSSRHTTLSAKLNDFVYSNVYSHQSVTLLPSPTKGMRYPMANFVSYHHYTPACHAFVAQLSTIPEPKSYAEAVVHPEWQEAMRSKLHALQANGT